ncbi:MAG: L-histidine N(alpha)-methyltransferase [Henriciella sp.]
MDDAFDPAAAAQTERFLKDVIEGLSQPQKTLPCQYFYDEVGSNLFEQITELPEYYPTRTEIGILTENAKTIAEALGPNTLLVEYGAGASTKTRILLDALIAPAGYVPIDVSEEFLLQTAAALKSEYPDLAVRPIAADFMVELGLPEDVEGTPVGFFPGSTIGNLDDSEIDRFLRAARTLLGDDSKFVIGLDLRKSPDILVPAYDDAQGVTAAFNLNLLQRINRELGADIDLDTFQHEAIWNDDASRIEMHLRSKIAQTVSIGDMRVQFAQGETIHTENSRKFDLTQFVSLISPTGWALRKKWGDERNFFAVLMLEAQ